jgi:hypothetical protein
MSEQTRRIAEGILDRLNVSTEDFAALNVHLHSEHAGGYKAGVLAGLRWLQGYTVAGRVKAKGDWLVVDSVDLDDAIAHVEATGGLREEKEVPW